MSPSVTFFCLCIIIVCCSGERVTKTKRDVSGLYPFPRVGKGDVSWAPLYLGPREMKRQGLIPFPRVGRNQEDGSSGEKRDASEKGGGMWFGPRLGRLQKRNHLNEDNNNNNNWALVQIRGLQDSDERKEYLIPNIGREFIEDTDQNKDYRT